MNANRRHRRPTSRTTRQPEPVEREPLRFMSYTGTEIMALTETDLDQLDDLQGEPAGKETWWALWRLERVEQQDQEASYGRS